MFQYLNSLDLAPVFSIEEFKHWFIPRKGIVDSYVVEVCCIILSVGQKKDAHKIAMQSEQSLEYLNIMYGPLKRQGCS